VPKAKDTSHIDWTTHFYYDEISPSKLRWARNAGQRAPIGSVAGCLNKSSPYYRVRLDGQTYQVQRIIWELHFDGLKPEDVVDHEDGNSLNNLIGNLRKVTTEVNTRNRRARTDNSSGVQGVSRTSNGNGSFYWTACWCELNGKACRKAFSVKKYGDEKAFNLACDFRATVIDSLNANGAGYTDRHTNSSTGVDLLIEEPEPVCDSCSL
jgi:hypothetical protein